MVQAWGFLVHLEPQLKGMNHVHINNDFSKISLVQIVCERPLLFFLKLEMLLIIKVIWSTILLHFYYIVSPTYESYDKPVAWITVGIGCFFFMFYIWWVQTLFLNVSVFNFKLWKRGGLVKFRHKNLTATLQAHVNGHG